MDSEGEALKKLHKYCVDRELPLPYVKIKRKKSEGGFVARCFVATLSCCGGSDTIEEARHKAAIKMLSMISIQKDNQDITEKPTLVRLCDRHNYFKNFPQVLKVAAFEAILRPHKYNSIKEQAMGLLAALELPSTTKELPTMPGKDQLLKLTIDCEIDCFFLGTDKQIYGEIIEYFQTMLV
ncbi:hypothetical protein KR032_009520 [Drosophila birchii]|nr:hypothetical protein KR032_009520 [Drosophila birchii]